MMKASLQKITIVAMLTTLVGAYVVLASGNLTSKNRFNRTYGGITVNDGTITFSGSDTKRSSTTYKTESNTVGGNQIISIARNCESNISGSVAPLKAGMTINFYKSDETTEFEFQSLKSITFNRSNFGACSYTYTYTLDTGAVITSSMISQGANEYTKTINLSSLGTVTKLSIAGISNNNETVYFSSIVLTYDCGEAVVKTLTGISITTPPTKTSYNAGESFDVTGMVVTGYYDDSSTRDITALCTITPSRALTADDTEVTVSYGGFTDTCEITVSGEVEQLGYYYAETSSTAYAILDLDNLYYRYVSTNQFAPKDLTYNILITNIVAQSDGQKALTIELDTSKSTYDQNFSGFNLFNGSNNLVNNTGVISANKQTLTIDRYYSSSSTDNTKSGSITFALTDRP